MPSSTSRLTVETKAIRYFSLERGNQYDVGGRRDRRERVYDVIVENVNEVNERRMDCLPAVASVAKVIQEGRVPFARFRQHVYTRAGLQSFFYIGKLKDAYPHSTNKPPSIK